MERNVRDGVTGHQQHSQSTLTLFQAIELDNERRV